MHHENEHDDAAVERHLNAQRAELAPVELDRVKRGVLAKAARQGGRGMFLRSRLAVMLIAIGLVGTGGGAVLAASGGSSSHGSSSNKEYCPDSSPGHGKPKHHHGNKCGHPKDCNKKNNGNGKDKCKCDKKNHKKCPH
jgi:hypothetical protein